MKNKFLIFKSFILQSLNFPIFTFLTLQFAFLNLQCEKPVPPNDDKPPYRQFIELTKDDVGVTEAWLKVKFLDSLSGSTFKVTRNGQTIFTKTISKLDTMLLDDGLLPNRRYEYKAYRLRRDTPADSSSVVTLTTMDTTSHDFTWQVDTLGEGTTMIGRDVFIVNDTCVWVVGNFNKKDSASLKKYSPYNAARWNGTKWDILMVPTEDYGGYISNSEIYTVYGFGPNDVWMFADQGAYSHWDGLNWQTKFIPERCGTGTKFWGSRSNNLYLVGTNGSITCKNGINWQIMITNTDVDFKDIWGSPDGSVVWATGYYYEKRGTYLYKYSGTNWSLVYDGTNSQSPLTPDSISGVISTVWTNSNKKVFVGVGAGIFLSEANANWKSRLITPFRWLRTFPNRIRGNDINDMFIVGTYGFIGHYNGKTVKQYSQFYSNKNLIYSVAQKGNLVVAVGIGIGDFIFHKAIVFIGRR
jgi:hypothetical protein